MSSPTRDLITSAQGPSSDRHLFSAGTRLAEGTEGRLPERVLNRRLRDARPEIRLPAGQEGSDERSELFRSLHDLGVLRAGQDRQAAVGEEVTWKAQDRFISGQEATTS